MTEKLRLNVIKEGFANADFMDLSFALDTVNLQLMTTNLHAHDFSKYSVPLKIYCSVYYSGTGFRTAPILKIMKLFYIHKIFFKYCLYNRLQEDSPEYWLELILNTSTISEKYLQ